MQTPEWNEAEWKKSEDLRIRRGVIGLALAELLLIVFLVGLMVFQKHGFSAPGLFGSILSMAAIAVSYKQPLATIGLAAATYVINTICMTVALLILVALKIF